MGDYDICLKVLSRIFPDDVTALAFPGMGLQGCQYRVVKLWEMDYAGLALGREAPGLAPLIPLMRHQERPEEAFRLSLKVLEGMGDQATRNELYGLTYLLAGLIYPKELLKGLLKKEILLPGADR